MRVVQRIGFGNPQPSGPRYIDVCVDDLYSLSLVSLPCGIFCNCAWVKSPFKIEYADNSKLNSVEKV